MSNPVPIKKEEMTAEKAQQMPIPAGWRILCIVPEIDSKFEGTDLIRPESTVDLDKLTTVVLFVLTLGNDCYADTAKYPNGALCKEGDFIVVKQYSGTRFRVHGKEFRIIYEDQVEAIVADPRGISRI